MPPTTSPFINPIAARTSPPQLTPAQAPHHADALVIGELGVALRSLGAKDGDTFLLKDDLDRVLCMQRHGTDTWGWAYMAAYASYRHDVYPVVLQWQPGGRLASLSVQVGGQQWHLFANGVGTAWEHVFFSANPWPGYVQPQLEFMAQPRVGTAARTYAVRWMNNGTAMSLRAGEGAWNWLTLSSTATNAFTLHKFYIDASKLVGLLAATWPGQRIDVQFPDADTQAISEIQARSIWAQSGLGLMSYRPNSFDCDDYAHVYKAQACRAAYDAKASRGYAVGLVYGVSRRGGHAANVFVDFAGRLKVIEPQSGNVLDAQSWNFTPDFIGF